LDDKTQKWDEKQIIDFTKVIKLDSRAIGRVNQPPLYYNISIYVAETSTIVNKGFSNEVSNELQKLASDIKGVEFTINGKSPSWRNYA
jgi:hypothetical protein